MKKSVIWLLTIVMFCTFIGFIYVQIMYLENLVSMRNEQFSELVSRSLYDVSLQLEQNETKYFLEENLLFAEPSIDAQISNDNNSSIKKDFSYSIPTPDGTSSYVIEGKLNSVELKKNETSGVSLPTKYLSQQEILKGQYLYQKGLLNEVILNILSESTKRPIEERADSTTVKMLLKNELANNGLDMPFEFALESKNTGVIYCSDNYALSVRNQQVYQQAIFANDLINRLYTLKVTFPYKSKYIYASIQFMIPTFLFSFILLCIFILTIIVAFRQKKLSEMKNDFIHNMTHELKTPIASISLAAQMLNDDTVRKSPAMLQQMAKAIGDETKRLQLQVEKVLQMSLFDAQKATLKFQDIDANAEIYNVINIQKIKAQKLGGSVEAHLDAIDAIVYVDKMHFTNIIFNILDNALKYCKSDVPPMLTVSTRNPKPDILEISIADNGIGIKKDDLKKIFEKFYRVSTGNLHDVKGFGLGLAYVYKMVTAFDGKIHAESEFGKGSNFIITLPLYK